MYISKLNSNGTVDSSFGNNGETVISNYFTPVDSQLTKQPDGKLLVMDSILMVLQCCELPPMDNLILHLE
jgi:hypothetical protein